MTADTITAIKKALEGVTPGPWKAVSDAHFDSGLVYTSVQPINVDEEAMKPLAMANGEYHVCRMSHTAAPWRFNYHRKNAHYIAAVNPEAISQLLSTLESLQRDNEELRAADMPQSPWPASGWALDRIAELEKALKPFAEVADFMDSETTGFSMTDTLHLQTHDELLPPFLVDVFCLERFYAARQALASTGGEHAE